MSEKFRKLLVREYTKRKKLNSNYSMRAFSLALDINPGCLSVLMNGKRKITKQMALRISQKLALTRKDIDQIFIEKDNDEYVEFNLDHFSFLSEWYYDAILELALCSDFKSDAKWISEKLNVDIFVVKEAIETLIRLGQVEIDQDGDWRISSPCTDLHLNEMTSPGLKKLQEDILGRSNQALFECPLEKRYHSSFMLAIDPKDIDEAKDELRKFRKKFCKKMQKNKELKEVYQLQLGFFPIHY